MYRFTLSGLISRPSYGIEKHARVKLGELSVCYGRRCVSARDQCFPRVHGEETQAATQLGQSIVNQPRSPFIDPIRVNVSGCGLKHVVEAH